MLNSPLQKHGQPLRQINPGFSEEELYQTARLIVAALNARIHTTEWTPALLSNDLMNVSMHNNWCAPHSAYGDTGERFSLLHEGSKVSCIRKFTPR